MDSNNIDGYYGLIRKEIFTLLPEILADSINILEIGCGTGATLSEIKKKFPRSVHTIGIEIEKDLGAILESTVDEYHNIDAESQFDEIEKLYRSKIDILLLLDILEHLNNPWQFLEKCKKSLLSNSGLIIISLPNIRNVKVLFPLIFSGEWEYSSAGILDRTHLRFFTRKSAVKMIAESGLEVLAEDKTGPFTLSNIASISGLFAYIFNRVTFNLFCDFLVHQHLFKVRKRPD